MIKLPDNLEQPFASVKNPDLSYHIVSYSPGSKQVAEYITLRRDVFRAYGMPYYRKAADKFDLKYTTRFILVLNKSGEVVAGRRILVHEPHSQTRLKTDDTIIVSLQKMLPHLPLDELHYAELTSLVVGPKAKGRGLSEELYDVTFQYCRRMKMNFLVVEAVPTNIRAFLAAAKRHDCKQIVPRTEARSIDGDEDFRIFVSFHTEEQLPMLAGRHKKKGLGQPLTEARIDALIQYRDAIKAERLETEKRQNLLRTILGEVPTEENLVRVFYGHKISWSDIQRVHDYIQTHSITATGPKGDDIEVPAALALQGNGKSNALPFILLSQIHGNEPAGLGAALFTIALEETGLLDRPVHLVIGNHYAAKQYFEAWAKDPRSRQESRDDFRMGLASDGKLMRDLNRIPTNVWEMDANEHYHTARAQQLDALAASASGILDVHSARGDLPCVTTYSDAKALRYSPIRIVLEGLLESIAQHTSTVTFKQLTSRHTDMKESFGIEAGTHEDPLAPMLAAGFAHALFYNLGITRLEPHDMEKETGTFQTFHVGKVMPFSALRLEGKAGADELFYTVKEGVAGDEYITKEQDGTFALTTSKDVGLYALHQYGELEEVKKDQLVAISVPSGAKLYAPIALHTLFAAKSKKLYRDPAAAVVPFTLSEFSKKFCHPCQPGTLKL